MRELSQELVKAGIIEEMVSDSMPNQDELEDEEEAEAEVDKILGEILTEKVSAPGAQLPAGPSAPIDSQQAEEEDLDSEEMLAQMRGRLQALKS
jgi:charged multivesicular body protein 3